MKGWLFLFIIVTSSFLESTMMEGDCSNFLPGNNSSLLPKIRRLLWDGKSWGTTWPEACKKYSQVICTVKEWRTKETYRLSCWIFHASDTLNSSAIKQIIRILWSNTSTMETLKQRNISGVLLQYSLCRNLRTIHGHLTFPQNEQSLQPDSFWWNMSQKISCSYANLRIYQ